MQPRRKTRKGGAALLALLLAAMLVACGPEAGRQRGEQGADVGNTPAQFEPKSKVFSDKHP